MPRKYRITDTGFYHVINRGVERRVVFLEEEDYQQGSGTFTKLFLLIFEFMKT